MPFESGFEKTLEEQFLDEVRAYPPVAGGPTGMTLALVVRLIQKKLEEDGKL